MKKDIRSEFEPFFAALKEDLNGESMEPFVQHIYYGDNCTVIFTLEPEDGEMTLCLDVIGGIPRYVNASCELFAPAAEDV